MVNSKLLICCWFWVNAVVLGASCAAATVFICKVLQDPRMTVLLFGMLPANLATIGK